MSLDADDKKILRGMNDNLGCLSFMLTTLTALVVVAAWMWGPSVTAILRDVAAKIEVQKPKETKP